METSQWPRLKAIQNFLNFHIYPFHFFVYDAREEFRCHLGETSSFFSSSAVHFTVTDSDMLRFLFEGNLLSGISTVVICGFRGRYRFLYKFYYNFKSISRFHGCNCPHVAVLGSDLAINQGNHKVNKRKYLILFYLEYPINKDSLHQVGKWPHNCAQRRQPTVLITPPPESSKCVEMKESKSKDNACTPKLRLPHLGRPRFPRFSPPTTRTIRLPAVFSTRSFSTANM